MEDVSIFGKCLMSACILLIANCAVGFISTVLEFDRVGTIATYAIMYQMTVYFIVFPIWGLIKLWRS